MNLGRIGGLGFEGAPLAKGSKRPAGFGTFVDLLPSGERVSSYLVSSARAPSVSPFPYFRVRWGASRVTISHPLTTSPSARRYRPSSEGPTLPRASCPPVSAAPRRKTVYDGVIQQGG